MVATLVGYKYARFRPWLVIAPTSLALLPYAMTAHLPDTKFSLAPPLYTYITLSIDVAATLKLYCGGGDEAMLQKLDGLQDHKYAGYCLDVHRSVASTSFSR